MNLPNHTFRELLGKRILSIETPQGFVHVVDDQVFRHESDAVRAIKRLPRTVIDTPDGPKEIADGPVSQEELLVTEPVEVKE